MSEGKIDYPKSVSDVEYSGPLRFTTHVRHHLLRAWFHVTEDYPTLVSVSAGDVSWVVHAAVIGTPNAATTLVPMATTGIYELAFRWENAGKILAIEMDRLRATTPTRPGWLSR